MKKPITIARYEDLADYEKLRNNPKIVKCIELPYGYVLYNFYDPIFDEIFGKNVKDRSYKIYTDPSLKSKAIELRDEENSFLQPLFDRSTITNFVSGLIFVINNESYEYHALRKNRLIYLSNYFSNNINEPACNIVLKLKTIDKKIKLALDKVISDWVVWCDKYNMSVEPIKIVYTENEVQLNAAFFDGYEDIYAALIVMLNHAKNKTGCNVVEIN